MKINSSMVNMRSERLYEKSERTGTTALNTSSHKDHPKGHTEIRVSDTVLGYSENVELSLSRESSQSTTITYGNTTVKTESQSSVFYQENSSVAAGPRPSGPHEIKVEWISEESRLLAMQLKDGAAPKVPNRIVNVIDADFAAAVEGAKLIPAVPQGVPWSAHANQARTQTLSNGMKLNPMQMVFSGYTEIKAMTNVQTEITAFQAKGVALTEDGKEIAFDVSVELTSSFVERMESMRFQPRWPARLHLNVPAGMDHRRNERFLFDYNPKGVRNILSLLSIGDGVLAVDKNRDGKINPAKELLNSFEELKELDQDGNGWLDENDAAFNNVMIWSPQENGPARLVGLIEGNVGAIFLDYAATQHTLSESSTLKNSGVYLKENGGAGVVQQIDIKL